MTRYRTIVADPPWEIGAFPEWGDGKGTIATPYPTMTLDEIKALPVGDFAAPEAHLYLWTTVEFLIPSYDVARAWGFEAMYPLHWCKPPRGQGLGGKYASRGEYEQWVTDPGSRWLLLYMLDRLELTEHGSSVAGGWLTAKGEAVRDALAREEDDGFEGLVGEGHCVHGFDFGDEDHDCFAEEPSP